MADIESTLHKARFPFEVRHASYPTGHGFRRRRRHESSRPSSTTLFRRFDADDGKRSVKEPGCTRTHGSAHLVVSP